MDASTALDRVDSGVADVVDALGAAWVTYLLYPNPGEQFPFRRAVDLLNRDAVGRSVLVGAGVFLVDGEELPARREGVEKLARRLFLHDVEQLRFTGSATVEGLEALFDVVAEDDGVVREEGGILAMVGDAGTGITVGQRGLLNLGPGEGVPEEVPRIEEAIDQLDLPELARIAFTGAGPDEIAAAASTAPESVSAVEAFIAGYRGLHERVEESVKDPSGSLLNGLRLPTDDPYKTVRAYIESFFHLPRWMQIDVLERVLEDTSRPDHRMFLDQFSGHDLSEALPDLSDGASDSLLGYAVEASGLDAGHPLDLLAGLSSAGDVEAKRLAVAERVSTVLANGEPIGDVLEGIREEMEEPADESELESRALRTLFECESRRDRFQRITRVWTARIARYVKHGDLERAVHLLRDVQQHSAFVPEHADLVRKSLERLTTPELLRTIAAEQAGEQRETAELLLSTLGRQVVDEVIIQLAAEEDRAVRRQLIELLAAAARDQPEAIDPYLKDQRWFVVRNLVTALAHTGNKQAARSVKLVASHVDHRVRNEVLRALVTLQGADATTMVVKALHDEDEQVRQTAATLLRGAPTVQTELVLAEELQSGKLPTDSAIAVIEILGACEGEPSGRALAAIAGRRFAFGARTRGLRAAARGALGARRV